MVIDTRPNDGKAEMSMTEMVKDTIASNHALIKQLGEALVEAIRLIDASTEPPLHNAQIFTAEAAFNHWKKGQS